MLEAKVANTALFKKIVESIKDLVTDASFEFTETGMSLQAMDSAHVAGVSLKLTKDFFTSFKCDGTTTLGIKLDKLLNHLKFLNIDDTCVIKYDESQIDSLSLKLINQRREEKTTDMVIKTMEINEEKLGIPEKEFSVVCAMESNEFQKLCRNMDSISCDALNISVDKSAIKFTGKGDSGSSVVTYLPSHNIDNESDAVYLEVTRPVSANYSLKYLSKFAKAGLAERVRLSSSNDDPIVVEYVFEDCGFLKFYLAPKVDDVDMD